MLVTAWHVVDAIGAGAEGAVVRVDPLAGGKVFGARVSRLDPVHDLAVLAADKPLTATVAVMAETGEVPLRTKVKVTGHAVLPDAGRRPRFLTAIAEWAGGTMWDDAVPVGRMIADAVVPGMSGAPVIRESDDAVVGVVSGRFNSPDGWLAGTVWVARTEDLVPLLAGLAEVAVEEVPYADAVDLVFTVSDDQVRLTGPGVDVSAVHGGVRPGLAEAVQEVRRSRARAGQVSREKIAVGPESGELALSRAGRLLAESFMPLPVADQFEQVLRKADQAHVPVQVGLVVPPGLAGLPWECLPDPCDQRPLALRPLVSVYRRVQAGRVREVPGPLRIVVAIAAPDVGGSGVLDYERELRNVIAAVRSARQGAAHVRVVPFASPAAIYAALDAESAHILHVSGHGSPGLLELEDSDGTARRVTAADFLEEAIPPGKMPPMIALAACYTDAIAAEGGPSFANQLCQHGAAVVIGTETSVTDRYATRVFARLYGRLAQAGVPDAIAALADARREVQRELAGSLDERDHDLAALDEWAVVTVLAGSGSVRVFDPQVTGPVSAPAARPQVAGMGLRETGYFVGRRPEQRYLPRELVSPESAGLVIYGIGGVGKTALATEIAGSVLADERDRVQATLTGQLSIEGLLSTVISALRRKLLVRGAADGEAMEALTQAARADMGWEDRLALLREHLLDQVPLLVVLDNFEDNLHSIDGVQSVRDEILGALLAAWVTSPGRSRLLFTSRFQFTLPAGAERVLAFRQIGPLSLAETMKLAWSLPALDRLDEAQFDQAWRLVGGHPRSLEYLDALLSGGTARYPDVTARLTEAVAQRLEGTRTREWLAAKSSLDTALAEVVALAADDALLDELLGRLRYAKGAEGLLLGASVYREPVDTNALLFQVGEYDESAASTHDWGARERIKKILDKAGIAVDAFDLSSLNLHALPARVQAALAPHVAEFVKPRIPPFRPPKSLQDMITACRASSLLIVDGASQAPRFFVHRWTAAELVQKAAIGRDSRLGQAHHRAASYWQWRAEVWPQNADEDVHDLLEARHHLLAAGETENAIKLSERVVLQLGTIGARDDEESIIHDTLARLPEDSPLLAKWIQELASLAFNRGDYAEANRHSQRCLQIGKRLGDQATMAAASDLLGLVAQCRGNNIEAERRFRGSLRIRRRLGHQAGIAASYIHLGRLAKDSGDYTTAERHYQHSLEIFEQLGSLRRSSLAGMAATHKELGILLQHRGEYTDAERHYQQALKIYKRLEDQTGVAAIYHQIGNLAQLRGNRTTAGLPYHQRSLEISERLGNQATMAATYYQLGISADQRGDYTEAARQCQRSLEIFERLGDQAGMAAAYHQLGNLAKKRGDYTEAARQCQRSLEISERTGDQATMAATYFLLGTLADDQGDYTEAERQYQRSLEISQRIGDQDRMASNYGSLGHLAYLRNDYAEAEHQNQRSLEIFERLGNQTGMAVSNSLLGFLAQERGDHAEAKRHYQRSLKIFERLGEHAMVASVNQQLSSLAQQRDDCTKA